MRYEAQTGSGHECCFRAQVVDKTKPIMIGGEHYKNEYECVCECYDLDTASQISDALNREALQ